MIHATDAHTATGAMHRIPALDIARSVALLAMVVFHLTYDLALFRLIDPDTAFTPFWALFARMTAGSFLFLAGVSLWLAHGRGIRWPSFLRRLAILAAAAIAVSLGTRFGMGEAWVRFGILHSIAACSVLGLLFLRLPAAVTAAAAIAAFFAPGWIDPATFSHPAWVWLVKAEGRPGMVDYVPLLPWAAPFLAGMVLGRVGTATGLWRSLARAETPLTRRLSWPGRHSLAIYLVHQPVLIGLVWAWARFVA